MIDEWRGLYKVGEKMLYSGALSSAPYNCVDADAAKGAPPQEHKTLPSSGPLRFHQARVGCWRHTRRRTRRSSGQSAGTYEARDGSHASLLQNPDFSADYFRGEGRKREVRAAISGMMRFRRHHHEARKMDATRRELIMQR
jgi:hypothetical protein